MVRKNRVELKWENKAKQIQKTKKHKKDIEKDDSNPSEYCSVNKSISQISNKSQKRRKQKSTNQKSLSKRFQVNSGDSMLSEIANREIGDVNQKQQEKKKDNLMPNQRDEIEVIQNIEMQQKYLKFPQNLDEKQNNKEKFNAFLSRLSSTIPSLRTSQKEKIKKFLKSETDFILYITGVTGSGKTTTLTHILSEYSNNSQISEYAMINCLHEFRYRNQQYFINKVMGLCQNNEIIVIDQCDYVKDLSRLIATIREYYPRKKIVLLCNSNCVQSIVRKENVDIVLFVQYKKEEVQQITKLKLGNLYYIVPKSILNQATIKAMSKSGDYREVEKYLQDWARTNLKQQNQGQKPHRQQTPLLQNPLVWILQKNIESGGLKKALLLKTIISYKPKINKSKKLECRCKQTDVKRIGKQCSSIATYNQFIYHVRQWEQCGILKIQPIRCHLHSSRIQLGTIKVLQNKALLDEILTKAFTQFQCF